jgi:transposase-like protein
LPQSPRPQGRPGRRGDADKSLSEPADREVGLAIKVAYALERGCGPNDIAARLGVSHTQVMGATRRVERACKELEPREEVT